MVACKVSRVLLIFAIFFLVQLPLLTVPGTAWAEPELDVWESERVEPPDDGLIRPTRHITAERLVNLLRMNPGSEKVRAMVVDGLVSLYLQGRMNLSDMATLYAFNGTLEPDPDVRLAAAEAMAKVRSFPDSHLCDYLSCVKQEQHPAIQQRLYEAMAADREFVTSSCPDQCTWRFDDACCQALALLGPEALELVAGYSYDKAAARDRAVWVVQQMASQVVPQVLDFLQPPQKPEADEPAEVDNETPMDLLETDDYDETYDHLDERLLYESFWPREFHFVLESLRDVGPRAKPYYLEAMEKGRKWLRLAGAVLMAEQNDPAAVPVLLDELKTESSLIRKWVLQALANVADERCVQPMIDLLKNPDDENASYATRVLVRTKDRRAVPYLRDAMRHGRSIIDRCVAAWGLARLGEADGREFLLTQARNPENPHRFWTYALLADIGDPRVEELAEGVRAMSEAPQWEVREDLLTAFTKTDNAALPALREMAGSGPEWRFHLAVEAAGRIATPEAASFLLELLRQGRVRPYLIEQSLEAIGENAVGVLLEAAQGPPSKSRYRVLKILARLGEERSVPLLVESLDEPSLMEEKPIAVADLLDEIGWLPGNLREKTFYLAHKGAVETLEKMGPAAIEALLFVMEHGFCNFQRNSAWTALQKMEKDLGLPVGTLAPPSSPCDGSG